MRFLKKENVDKGVKNVNEDDGLYLAATGLYRAVLAVLDCSGLYRAVMD